MVTFLLSPLPQSKVSMQKEMLNDTENCLVEEEVWEEDLKEEVIRTRELPLANKCFCKHNYVSIPPFNPSSPREASSPPPQPCGHHLPPPHSSCCPDPPLSILLAFSSSFLPPTSLMLICFRLNLFTNAGLQPATQGAKA